MTPRDLLVLCFGLAILAAGVLQNLHGQVHPPSTRPDAPIPAARSAALLAAAGLLYFLPAILVPRAHAVLPKLDAAALALCVHGLLFYGGVLLSARALKIPSLPRIGRGECQAGTQAYFTAVPWILVVGFLWQWFVVRLGGDGALQEPVNLLLDPGAPLLPKVCLILLALVAAPVVEELLFRRVLLPEAGRRLGRRSGVLVTSLAFTTVHAHLASAGALFAIAVALARLRLRTGGTGACIVFHAWVNAVTIALALLAAT